MQKTKQANRFRIFLACITTVLLVLSCCFPGFANEGNPREVNDGWFLFSLGWMVILGGAWEAVFWVANPLIVIAIFRLLLNKPGALKLSVIALVIALSFLLLPDITASEAGGRAEILWIGTGYWLWVASMFSMVSGMLYYQFVLMKK